MGSESARTGETSLEAQVAHVREDMYRSRTSQKRWGIGLSIFGFVTLVDSGSPFPIPLVGLPSILVGLALVVIGLTLLYREQALPLAEALEVATLHQGYLSGPLLVRALHVTPATAERMLEELSHRGWARIEDSALENGEIAYRVLGLNLPAPRELPPGGAA